MLAISDGNNKLGRIPNLSVRPVVDCGNCAKCAKLCYARKAYQAWPSVKKAWTQNGKAFRTEDYGQLWTDVSSYLEHKQPQYFRIHVSGDFIGQGQLDFWLSIAWAFESVRFLAFTKMHKLDFTDCPGNMTMVFSMWPGVPDNAPDGPRAWMDDGTDDRIPADAIPCPGHCEACGMCWSLPHIGRDVVFSIH